MQLKTGRYEKVDALWPQVKALSYPELKLMREAITDEMKEKSEAIRDELPQRVAALGEEYGLSIRDVVGKRKRRAKKPGGEAAVAYQNPDNPQETWKGAGRKPKWLKVRLDAGEDLEAFAIKTEPQQEQ